MPAIAPMGCSCRGASSKKTAPTGAVERGGDAPQEQRR